MPFAWFVALRYLRSAWGQTALIVSAVAVGVAVVVFLSALMGGLQDSLIDKILGSQAHVRVTLPREAPRRFAACRSPQAPPRITRESRSIPVRHRGSVAPERLSQAPLSAVPA
jgi:lipoprotein-releasing system permease protein